MLVLLFTGPSKSSNKNFRISSYSLTNSLHSFLKYKDCLIYLFHSLNSLIDMGFSAFFLPLSVCLHPFLSSLDYLEFSSIIYIYHFFLTSTILYNISIHFWSNHSFSSFGSLHICDHVLSMHFFGRRFFQPTPFPYFVYFYLGILTILVFEYSHILIHAVIVLLEKVNT